MHEWPLLFFTLLFQFSVGAFIFVEYIGIQSGNATSGFSEIHRKAYLISGAALALSLLFSVFHLGSPFRALNSLLNLESSWLSREIFFVSAFALLFSINFLIVVIKKKTANKILLLFTGVIGLTAVFTMTKIYMLPTIPLWNNMHTPIAFFSTALLLGSLIAIVLFVKAEVTLVNYKHLIFLSTLFILISLLNEIYFAAAINDVEFNTHLIVLRILLLISVLIISLKMAVLETIEFTSLKAYYFLFFLAVVSEVLGRILFYNSFYSIGL